MKKTLTTLLFVLIIGGCGGSIRNGCCYGGYGYGSGGVASLALAGGVIGAGLVAHAFTSAQQAGVANKAIEAHVLLESACKVGPGGKVTYASSKEDKAASLENNEKTLSPDDCAKLARAQAEKQTYSSRPVPKRAADCQGLPPADYRSCMARFDP